MHIRDLLAPAGPKFSFEYFPPKSAAGEKALSETVANLQSWNPAFVSVTYGAGGSTRANTREWVGRLLERRLETIPHLTCVGHTARDIDAILESYALSGVSNILALRGDPPRHAVVESAGDFPHAVDLVAHVRRFSERHGHGLGIGVAGFPEGHPATPNRLKEMDYLKAKVDAGADYICTQLFFDNGAFYDFRERCELAGIRVPIVAGILPVTSLEGLTRMAELAAGVRVPARLLRALHRAGGDAAAVRRVGIHHAASQCADLLDHEVSGIHFYTLNQSEATVEILRSLGLRPHARCRASSG